MDDSHGIAAYGRTGRGTEEHCGAGVDIFVGTFGKAFGVNGGFVAASAELVEAVRQKADTYIYTNPLGAADAAAAVKAIDVADSAEGRARLANLQARTTQFRRGLESLGFESIPGPHPVVPLLVRDTGRVRTMVAGLFERGILAVGLTYPVVPKGDETIRFQINAAHTEGDIDELLGVLKRAAGSHADGLTECLPASRLRYTSAHAFLRSRRSRGGAACRRDPRVPCRADPHHHATRAARLQLRRRLLQLANYKQIADYWRKLDARVRPHGRCRRSARPPKGGRT